MGKRAFLLLIYCLAVKYSVLIAQTDEQNYFLKNIDRTFIGYYISMDFIVTFEETKNYSFARDTNYEYPYYAHIIVRENGIECYPFYSDVFYEVSEDNFNKFVFEHISVDEAIITEPNGKKYKRMTTLNGWENYMAVMNNYIGNIVLEDLISDGRIIIENDFFYIPSLDNKRFQIVTWQRYYNEDIRLALLNNDLESERRAHLKIENNELTINYDPPVWYRGERFYVIWKTEL